MESAKNESACQNFFHFVLFDGGGQFFLSVRITLNGLAGTSRVDGLCLFLFLVKRQASSWMLKLASRRTAAQAFFCCCLPSAMLTSLYFKDSVSLSSCLISPPLSAPRRIVKSLTLPANAC